MTNRRQFLKAVAAGAGLAVMPPVATTPLSEGLVFFGTGVKSKRHQFGMDWIGYEIAPGGYWFTKSIDGVVTKRFVRIATPAHD